jgi:hypothetical protein
MATPLLYNGRSNRIYNLDYDIRYPNRYINNPRVQARQPRFVNSTPPVDDIAAWRQYGISHWVDNVLRHEGGWRLR